MAPADALKDVSVCDAEDVARAAGQLEADLSSPQAGQCLDGKDAASYARLRRSHPNGSSRTPSME